VSFFSLSSSHVVLERYASHPASHTLCGRKEVLDLLTGLSDPEDVATLSALCARHLDAPSTPRYLRRANALANIEPLLGEASPQDLGVPLLELLSRLLSTGEGVSYLVTHLEEPGALAGWLVALAAGSSNAEALIAQRDKAPSSSSIARLAIAIVSVAAVAASIDTDRTRSCSALLQVVASKADHRPVRRHVKCTAQ
jgi:hypothetical protein